MASHWDLTGHSRIVYAIAQQYSSATLAPLSIRVSEKSARGSNLALFQLFCFLEFRTYEIAYLENACKSQSV